MRVDRNLLKEREITFTHIGSCLNKGRMIVLDRDQDLKYYITVDGKITQKRLKANEMANWFLNAMDDGS